MNCHLVSRRDFDIPISYYSALDAGDAPDKLQARLRNSRDRIKLFRRFVPLTGWCDVGTGEGIFLETLRRAGGSGVGIEPSVPSRAQAQERGVVIAGTTVDEVASVVQRNHSQVVSLFHVIEHLERPDEALQKIYAALPKGGFLIIETPDFDSPVFRSREHQALIYPEHLWYFSTKTLCTLVKQSGFEIVASGRRDFDQNNLSIWESLQRLGLPPQNSWSSECEPTPRHEHGLVATKKNSILRSVVRKVLNRLVVLGDRLEYVWIVASK